MQLIKEIKKNNVNRIMRDASGSFESLFIGLSPQRGQVDYGPTDKFAVFQSIKFTFNITISQN